LSRTLLYIQAKYRTSGTGRYPSVWGQIAFHFDTNFETG
jgi:hypothetical protein